MKVEHRQTGIEYHAIYAANKQGNMRYWVEGKFYTDKLFDRTFKIKHT